MDSWLDMAQLRINVALGLPVAFMLWATVLGGSDSGLVLELLRTPGFDKIVHIVVYGGITALFIATLGDGRLLRFLPVWPSVFLAISAADELRQRGVPGRDFSRDDMIANIVGVTIGWLLGRTLHRSRSIQGSPPPISSLRRAT